MNYEDLTPEQKEKARACTTVDELVALAMAEGVEIGDEQLEKVAGGDLIGWDDLTCERDYYH